MKKNVLSIILFAALAALPSSAKAAEKGDVNNDGEVNAADVSLLRDIVLGKQTTSLSSSVTDINGDGVLSVTDVTRLIKHLKEREEGGLNVDINGWDESGEDYGGTVKAPRILRSVTRIDEKTWEMDLSLSSDVEINGFQLILNLPDGLELVEYSSGIYGSLTSRNVESHVIYNGTKPADGKLMFLAYSDNNDLFSGLSGNIMKFKIKASNGSVPANCDVTVSSIEMSSKECKAIRPSDFVVLGKQIVDNENAFTSLSALISSVQSKLDDAKAKIASECPDVADNYTSQASEIQAMIDSITAELKAKYEAIELTDESTVDLSAIEAAIEKMLSDALAAQEKVGIENATIDDSNSIVDVYSINGANVKSKITISDATKGLPSGVYIINNEKVFVK